MITGLAAFCFKKDLTFGYFLVISWRNSIDLVVTTGFIKENVCYTRRLTENEKR